MFFERPIGHSLACGAAAALFAVISMGASPAGAAWDPGGLPVCTASGVQTGLVAVPDGSSGRPIQGLCSARGCERQPALDDERRVRRRAPEHASGDLRRRIRRRVGRVQHRAFGIWRHSREAYRRRGHGGIDHRDRGRERLEPQHASRVHDRRRRRRDCRMGSGGRSPLRRSPDRRPARELRGHETLGQSRRSRLLRHRRGREALYCATERSSHGRRRRAPASSSGSTRAVCGASTTPTGTRSVS